MWGTGELTRTCEHVRLLNGDGKAPVECMVIRRPLEPTAQPVVIELRNAHFYYPRTREETLQAAMVVTQFMVNHLRLPVDTVSIRRFIDYIQDGFDELMDMKPAEVKKQAVGEFSGYIGSDKLSGEILE
jgi:hypothetical protein